MLEFWEQRYREDGYAYGEKPNIFFKQFIDSHKPGKILLPAEGEGRNAVYAALKGWQVDAYDFSEKAVENSLDFAREHKVSINYSHASHDDLDQYDPGYDAIALIYVHVTNDFRQQFHQQLQGLLKQGGAFLMEAFTPEQLERSSGGPKHINMLYKMDDVISDFEKECDFEIIKERDEELDEGKYHVGKAKFIRMLALKK